MEVLEVARRKLVAESKAELVAASNQLDALTLDLEGTRKIFESTKSVSKDEILKKELDCKLAKAELERLTVGEEREDIEYRMAVAQLALRRIKAPFDGVIVKITPEVGENCSPQQPIVRIVDTRQCHFVTHVDAKKAWGLKAGINVPIVMDATEGGVTRQGTVIFVSPVADASSGLKEVKVLIDNSDGKVSPGVTGWLKLSAGAGK
jgi:multidrug resistance efflux pump